MVDFLVTLKEEHKQYTLVYSEMAYLLMMLVVVGMILDMIMQQAVRQLKLSMESTVYFMVQEV